MDVERKILGDPRTAQALRFVRRIERPTGDGAEPYLSWPLVGELLANEIDELWREVERLRPIVDAAEDWAQGAARRLDFLIPTEKALYRAIRGGRP